MSETTPQPPNTPVAPNKKARLGRGLGSLLGSGLEAESPTPETGSQKRLETPSSPLSSTAKPIDETAQIWKIPIDRLEPNTQQPRQHFASEALQELSASIKMQGILQPIVARRKGERDFEIIAGERRWRAAQLAGLHEVPVILRSVDEQNSLELAILENIQRQDLNVLEEAEAYDRLVSEYGLTQQQVADKVGKDRATVANVLRLLVLPRELKDLVKGGALSPGHAKVLLGVEDLKEQIKIGKKVAAEKLSVRATEQMVAQSKRALVSPPSSPLNLDVSKRLVTGLAAELQKLIGTKVTIDYSDGKGKLAIHFYSDEELNQMTEKIRAAWEK